MLWVSFDVSFAISPSKTSTRKAGQNLIVDFYLLGLSIARRLRLEVKALEIIADSSDASFLLRRLDFLYLPGHAHSSIVSTF